MPRTRKAVFPVNGQGTLIYTIKHKSEFTIYITPDKQKIPSEIVVNDDNESEEESFQTDNYISLTVGDHVARFNLKMKKDGEDRVILEKYGKDIGIDSDELVGFLYIL